MKRMGLLLALPAVGCGAVGTVGGLLGPTRTSVELVNNGDFPVDVRLFFDNDQLLLEEVLTELGNERTFLIQPGQSSSFSADCDDLQAIVIEDADLQVLGGAGPEDATDVLRDGDDFGCGDTIVFTFDHTDTIFDFSISVSTRNGP